MEASLNPKRDRDEENTSPTAPLPLVPFARVTATPLPWGQAAQPFGQPTNIAPQHIHTGALKKSPLKPLAVSGSLPLDSLVKMDVPDIDLKDVEICRLTHENKRLKKMMVQVRISHLYQGPEGPERH